MKLKGVDAVIYRALKAVRAYVTFHYVYYESDTRKDVILAVESHILTDEPIGDLRDKFDGRTLHKLDVFIALEAPLIKYKYDDEEGIEQERRPQRNEPKFATATPFRYFLPLGNEVRRHTVYASICMIASAHGHGGPNWDDV